MLAFGASTASAGVIADDFSTYHDYSGGNVAGTIWDGIRYNEGNISNVAANANDDTPGELHFESKYGNWEHGDSDGLFLYRNVSGDFVAEVQVTSANDVNWHDMGLIARVENLADAGAGEDWVGVRYFRAGGYNAFRNLDNGGQAGNDASGLQNFLQLERSGNTFTVRRKASAGASYVTFDSVTRADLDGLPLQVGIWHATFNTGNLGTATFDNFSLTGANVPEPATAAVLLVGLSSIIRRRRRSCR